MKYLFIDSTEKTVLGIVNQNLEFEKYCYFEDKKSASRIHSRLNNLLQEHKICLNNINKIYIVSGPGSYTGIRVIEGIAQIMKWQGKDILSFYQFEIPFMTGINQGVWISQAWKGEIFIYYWKNSEHSIRLVPSINYKPTGKEYSYGDQCNGFGVYSTRKLLLEHSKTVFKVVDRRGEYLPPYYYRSVEQEFKMD